MLTAGTGLIQDHKGYAKIFAYRSSTTDTSLNIHQAVASIDLYAATVYTSTLNNGGHHYALRAYLRSMTSSGTSAWTNAPGAGATSSHNGKCWRHITTGLNTIDLSDDYFTPANTVGGTLTAFGSCA